MGCRRRDLKDEGRHDPGMVRGEREGRDGAHRVPDDDDRQADAELAEHHRLVGRALVWTDAAGGEGGVSVAPGIGREDPAGECGESG